VIAWDWESLLACPHGKSPEGKYYRYGDPSSLRPLSETLCLTGNPQAGHLYSAGSEGVIHCHDIATGQEVHQFHGHRSAIHSLHFDPSSALLFSCDESCTVCVWGEPPPPLGLASHSLLDTRIAPTGGLQSTSQRRCQGQGSLAVHDLSAALSTALFSCSARDRSPRSIQPGPDTLPPSLPRQRGLLHVVWGDGPRAWRELPLPRWWL
jgi:WD40 repeat protein